MAPSNNPPTLSATDQKALIAVFYSFETLPKVNYTTFAELGGYKSVASAQSQYCLLKKKLKACAPAAALQSTSAEKITTSSNRRTSKGQAKAKTNAGGSKGRKRARDTHYDDEVDDAATEDLFKGDVADEDAKPAKKAKQEIKMEEGDEGHVDQDAGGTSTAVHTEETNGQDEGLLRSTNDNDDSNGKDDGISASEAFRADSDVEVGEDVDQGLLSGALAFLKEKEA